MLESTPTHTRTDSRTTLRVCAPGRLHLGFLDPSGSLGRPFGSLGLMIDGFETELEIACAHSDEICADTPAAEAELDRVASCLQRLRDRTGRREPLALRLRGVLPAHAGFGSGTQLALAVGRAFARWHELELATPTIAQWLGRGQRSGIGIAGFDSGGLLVDGGPGAHGAAAPLLARVALPAAWRIVVVIDGRLRGLSGRDEREAIAALAPLAQARAAEICHQVLMQILPGAAQAEFAPFAAGINRVQQLLGEHFAPAQSGARWTSPAIGRLMQWLQAWAGDTAAIGQSSWGPSSFAITESAGAARGLRVVAGRNHGALVSEHALATP
jgi:beta-ribofuranosylaminobenzene 5'-phosphate synthase